MSKKAARFIATISKDPKKVAQFRKDPDSAMKGHDLSEKDKEVLRTKDTEKIRKHLGDNAPPGCVMI
jgi:hypothetical protein